MAKALWRGKVIADSNATILVEGNHYFPPDSVRQDLLRSSATTSVCGWKGTANYYDIHVDGETNSDAAWYYGDPKEKAANIRGYIAFWKGVTVEDSDEPPAQEMASGEVC